MPKDGRTTGLIFPGHFESPERLQHSVDARVSAKIATSVAICVNLGIAGIQ